eukprot:TRINITY_DN4464_c0_g1_i1.p1 TRINITY_DN4464_c0_g1~~TRINITY_DN4464_c0_g1_i1.p1  ORF type:complete len:762 (+),score=189.02 TRINITY_DN4464_c0_g1_i1:37-2322(+)
MLLEKLAHVLSVEVYEHLESQAFSHVIEHLSHCVFTFETYLGSADVCFGVECKSQDQLAPRLPKCYGDDVRFFHRIGSCGGPEMFAVVVDNLLPLHYDYDKQLWTYHKSTKILSISDGMEVDFADGIVKVKPLRSAGMVDKTVRWNHLKSRIGATKIILHTLKIHNDMNLGEITHPELRVIRSILRENKCFQSFELKYGYIGDDATCEFAADLHAFAYIRMLDLSFNGIGESGCSALASMVLENTSVHALDLSGNRIGSAGCIKLINALKQKFSHNEQAPDWVQLALRDCELGAAAVLDVMKFAETHEFVEFDLRFNSFPHNCKDTNLMAMWTPLKNRIKLNFGGAPEEPSTIDRMIGSKLSGVRISDCKLEVEELGNPIGVGSFGCVYDCGNGRVVKVLYPMNRDAADQIVKELEIWKDWNHPNIVQFISLVPHLRNWGFEDKLGISVAFMMTKMDMTLRDFLAKNPGLLFRTRIFLLFEVAKALYYLHQRRIVHRDVHSRNVLLNHSKTLLHVSLGDFGLCQPLDSLLDVNNTVRSSSSKGNTIVPPDAHLTLSYDVFQFGVLMWEVLNSKNVNTERDQAQKEGLPIERWILNDTSEEQLTSPIYELMLSCLNDYASSRPSAKMIWESLKLILDELDYFDILKKVNPAFAFSGTLGSPSDRTFLRTIRNCTFRFVSLRTLLPVTAFGIETSWDWVKENSNEKRTSGGVKAELGAGYTEVKYFWTVGPGPETFAVAGPKVFYHDRDQWFPYRSAFLLSVN